MIYLYFILGFFIYTFSVIISYSDDFKSAWYYLPMGAALGAAATVLWLLIAKSSKGPSEIMINGLLWDSVILSCYLIIPWFFHSISLTGLQKAGIVLVVLGLGMTKL